jgi:hypothetical protein
VMNTYIAENLDFSVVIIPESLNPPQWWIHLGVSTPQWLIRREVSTSGW